MAQSPPMEVLCSPLLTLDELGAGLASLTVTVRMGSTGVTHAPHCRQVGKKAAAEQTLTVGELRAAGQIRPCRTCGGAVIQKLSDSQAKQLNALIPILETRVEAMRQAEREQRAQRERVHRADTIDKRAGHIVDGGSWKIAAERKYSDRYPANPRAAVVPCSDCDAEATIGFQPRSLEVTYACPAASTHGFLRLDDDEEPLATWPHRQPNRLVALSLVAPVLAGQDTSWALTYGTRVDDYQGTISALETFDQEHPTQLRLTPDIRCGDCGGPLNTWPGTTSEEGQHKARYSCDNRHEDSRYRSHEKSRVDEEIDWILHRRLHDHPSWATAPELEPDEQQVATRADDLARKISIFDSRVGAAKAVAELVETRARLAQELSQVTRIREQGALATAELPRYASGPASYAPRWEFTSLARTLLTTRIDVTKQAITVITPLDDGTPLHRLLRTREIQDELTELRHRQRTLEQELAALDRN